MRKPRFVLIVAACALVAGTVAGAKEVKVQNYNVMVDGVRLGWMKHERVIGDGKVITSWYMGLSVLRRGKVLEAEELETYEESTDGKPLSFRYRKLLGSSLDQCKGDVAEKGIFNVTGMTAGSMWNTEIEWPKGALLPEAVRKVMLEKGLNEGTEYSVTVFEPLTFQPVEMKVRVGPKKEIDIMGTPALLTEVRQVVPTAFGTKEITSYVDDDLLPMKRTFSQFDLKLELVACEVKGKSFRTTADEATWLKKCALASPAPLSGAADARPIAYELEFASDERPDIPHTPSQTVGKGGKNSVVVKVLPAAPTAGGKFPYEGQDRAAKKAMNSSEYLQSKDSKVIELARKAIGDAADAVQAARSIEAFVQKYLKKQPTSLTCEKATEALAKKQGDCTEFAVLTAAMCRAVGIPARTVCGVLYAKEFGDRKDVFVPHMWVEVFDGATWFGLDATGEPCDARRIALKLGEGDRSDFHGVFDVMGDIKIAKITLPPKGKD